MHTSTAVWRRACHHVRHAGDLGGGHAHHRRSDVRITTTRDIATRAANGDEALTGKIVKADIVASKPNSLEGRLAS